MDEAEDQTIVLNAVGRAQDLLRAYVEPGPRDAERTITDLLRIFDDEDVVRAHERMTWESSRP